MPEDVVPLKRDVALTRACSLQVIKKSFIKRVWHSSRLQLFIPFSFVDTKS